MASAESQKRWRQKNKLVKRQLNVMARRIIHDDLEDMANAFHLKGKGEAVTFATFITKALLQQADYKKDTAQMLKMLEEAYHRDREIYSP